MAHNNSGKVLEGKYKDHYVFSWSDTCLRIYSVSKLPTNPLVPESRYEEFLKNSGIYPAATIDKSTLASFEFISQGESDINVDATANVTFWFGVDAGMAAANASKRTEYLVSIELKDGSKLLLKLSSLGYEILNTIGFSLPAKKQAALENNATPQIAPPTTAVRVQGDPTPLLARAFMFLEEEDWENAEVYCESVLDIDPTRAEAYLGKLMLDLRVSKRESLASLEQPFDSNKNYQKALRFADESLRQELEGYIAQINARALDAAVDAARKKIAFHKKAEEFRSRLPSGLSTLIGMGLSHTVGLKDDGTIVATGNNDKGQCNVSKWSDIIAICAGNYHTVGLKADGTVVAAGDNEDGQCNVSDWTDIVAISAAEAHTVGLKRDGTAVAIGFNLDGQCNVSSWSGISTVCTSFLSTIGLKTDGTVVAVGDNEYGQCNVSGWTDIVAISASQRHTVGLKKDGTVVAEGNNNSGECNVSDWSDIVAIGAGDYCTVGLKKDGSIVRTHFYDDIACQEDIFAISKPTSILVGLKGDGTVAVSGDTSESPCDVADWSNIVAVFAGTNYAAGIKANGEVVATGDNEYGQCNVFNWKLFDSLDTCEAKRASLVKLAAERKAERERFEAEQRAKEAKLAAERKAEQKVKLSQEKASLTSELANLKGLFTGKRRKEIESRLAEIERTLADLG